MTKDLAIGGRVDAIYRSSDGTSFSLVRPAEKKTGLVQDYSIETNLQISAHEPNKPEFMPNHLRVFTDLELQRRFQVTPVNEMALLFDKVFYGADPEAVRRDASLPSGPGHLRPLDYDLLLAQLFLAEQEGYPKASAFDPKRLYLQGWIRCAISGEMEIDKLLWSAVRGGPPARFTSADNKIRKTLYDPNAKPLWWLTGGKVGTLKPS